MAFSMSRASLPVFEIGLNALSANLDKAAAFAAAKKIDAAVLLNARLAPDMFALTRQVQIATDPAKNGSARLAGVEPPKFEERFRGVHVLQRDANGMEKCVACFLCAAACPSDCIYIEAAENTADQAKNGSARLAGVEPPKFEDNETTIDQLKTRLAKTVAFLKTLDARQIDGAADREINFPVGPNKAQMRGDDYLNHFVLPNFYFHITAAYAILRHSGVEIGKRDFLGAIPLKMV